MKGSSHWLWCAGSAGTEKPKEATGRPPLESGFKDLTTRHLGRGHPAICWNKAWQAALPQIAAAELLLPVD